MHASTRMASVTRSFRIHRVGSFLVAMLACLAMVGATAGTNGLDASFGEAGFVAIESPPATGLTFYSRGGLAIADDGKIILGGWAAADGEFGSHAAVGRLLDDGSWDQSFANHGIFVLPLSAAAAPNGGEIHNVVVLSDHSIVAAGAAWVDAFGDFATCTLLLKLTSTGEVDESFGPEHSGSFCFDFAPNTDNHVVLRHGEGIVAGNDDTLYLTTPYTNLPGGAVAHFDSNGALIVAYGSNGIATFPATAVRLQLTSTKKIVALGAVGNPWAIAVTRLDAAGQPDLQFGDAGLLTFDPQPDGLVSPLFAMLDKQERLLIADNDEDSGNLLAYRFARVSATGTLDASFNGNSQQTGFPGLAAPELGAADYFNGLSAAMPLADGHVFGVGDAGPTSPTDGTYNLALVRLAEDSSFDGAFGDSPHPGWASINVGGTTSGTTRVRAVAADALGRAFVVVDASDGNLHWCIGILRLIPDRLLDSSFDATPAMPTCPQ